MAYVKLNLASTIDGYIARLDGSVDYLPTMEESTELTDVYNKFLSSIDIIIMGSKSYEVMLKFGDYPFKDKITYVMTRRSFEPAEGIVFTSEDILDLMSSTDKTVWLFGGGQLITSFAKLNLIDEYIISIVPIVLGEGIPLFNKFDESIKLKLVSNDRYNDFVLITYKK